MQARRLSRSLYQCFCSPLVNRHRRNHSSLSVFIGRNRPQPCQHLHQRSSQRDALTLKPGQVDVWWMHSEEATDVSLLNRYMELLTSDEQSYVREGSSEAVRKERLLARTLQRTTLARYCSEYPPPLRFERNAHGKPQLSWEETEQQPDPPIHFSLTHTTSLLGIAVSCGSLVGLDVEESNRHTKADPLRLARRRLAPAEVASLEAIKSAEGRAKRFVQLWTLKEAYVKAMGQGISAAPGLQGFSVLLCKDHGIEQKIQQITTARIADTAYRISFQTSCTQDQRDWGFLLLDLSHKHTAALCMQIPVQHLQINRQSSGDSDASTSTVYNDAASLYDSMDTQELDHQEAPSNDVCVTFRSTLPLVRDDVDYACHVQGAGGL